MLPCFESDEQQSGSLGLSQFTSLLFSCKGLIVQLHSAPVSRMRYLLRTYCGSDEPCLFIVRVATFSFPAFVATVFHLENATVFFSIFPTEPTMKRFALPLCSKRDLPMTCVASHGAQKKVVCHGLA